MKDEVVGTATSYWRDFVSVYYANTTVWKILKSAALVFLGLFCWAGGNLVMSYNPGATWLNYLVAYGAVLIFYGPFTHLVVVPLAIRWRRRQGGLLNKVGKKISKINITIFVVLVLIVGTYPPAVVMLDFDVGGDSDVPDVNPDLVCTQDADTIECELSDSTGIDHVVVSSGGDELRTVDEPPFRFELREDELTEVVGQKRFEVVLRDEDGNHLRSFRRSVRF